MNDALVIWNIVVERLSAELTSVAVDTWIRPCDPVSFDGSRLILRSDDFRKKILEERFSPLIVKILSEIMSSDDVGLVLLSQDEDYFTSPESGTEGNKLPDVPGYTFEDFIVGPSNQFAHAACVSVSQNPGQKFNPLFIYGNSGLGKTHLMLAIGYALQKANPKIKIAYEKGESFMNKLVQAIKDGTTASFREKYRNLDVLLIDDIQFIAGKQSTQDEFFHTFNALHEARHQIVITSDRPPKEMTLLSDRLRTRFEGGLMADIAPPDLETRIAIAKRKSEFIGLVLAEEDYTYLASKVKSNVRKLEGVLNKLAAYSSILDVRISKEIIDRAINEVDVIEGVPTAEVVIKETGKYFSLTPEQLRSENRSRNINTARQVAMYLMRKLTSMSFLEIGNSLGRNHSTAINSITKIEEQLKTDPKLKDAVRDIESNIVNTPGNLQ